MEDFPESNQNSRRGPDALRLILNDFEANATDNRSNYYDAQGEKIFLNFETISRSKSYRS
jgi:hypothetical protein